MSTAFLSRAIAWSASAFPSAADTPAPSCPARPASAAWQQAISNKSSARPRRQPFEKAQCPPGVGRGAGGVAQGAAGQPAPPQRPGQATAVQRPRRVLRDQPFVEGDRPFVGVAGLGLPAELAGHVAEVRKGQGDGRRGSRGPWGCRRPASGRSRDSGGARPPPPPACPSSISSAAEVCERPSHGSHARTR